MKATVGQSRWLFLLLYAIVNLVLYSMLLPLWEGFDEPFHFGYAQALASGTGFPDPRHSRLSAEIARSIELAPASVPVKRNLPNVTTYPDFFALPGSERKARHQQLFQIDPKLRSRPSQYLNYEGQQAPLAYVILALPEWALARMPLPYRIMALRIFCGSLGALLLFVNAVRLAARLNLSSPYSETLVFCAFSSQMTWATIAHVGNDWLAVPLALWLLVSVIDYHRCATVRRLVACTLILCLGLLTKAYFIAFVPLLVVSCIVRRKIGQLVIGLLILMIVAGPWYYRNLVRYHAISGMQELREGVNPAAALDELRMDKIAPVLDSDFRQALWTGNNTFRSFSVTTLRALIVVWLVGLVLWVPYRHNLTEWTIVGFVCLFLMALAYDSAINSVASHSNSPSPWYSQILLVPMLALALLGASRHPRIGRGVAVVLTLLFGYIIVATYWAKLIPLYSGVADRLSLIALLNRYKNFPAMLASLGEVSLGAPGVIVVGAFLVTCLSAAQAAMIARSLLKSPSRQSEIE